MKLKQHLDIGNRLFKILNSEDTGKLSKRAYLLGNIAPDLNCAFPLHMFKTTEKRFYRRLKIVDKSCNDIVKSFTLGVITHYICDYFCYVHNTDCIGLKHKAYETELYNYYEAHLDELKESSYANGEIKDKWDKIKETNLSKYADNNVLDTESHCQFILEQIRNMNKIYVDIDAINKSHQIQLDLSYTIFMTENILKLIINPFYCFVRC